MKIKHLDTAIQEAERFLERAKAAKAAHADAVRPLLGYEAAALAHPPIELNYSNPRENGALRRSSMDLTRALADLRRCGNG